MNSANKMSVLIEGEEGIDYSRSQSVLKIWQATPKQRYLLLEVKWGGRI